MKISVVDGIIKTTITKVVTQIVDDLPIEETVIIERYEAEGWHSTDILVTAGTDYVSVGPKQLIIPNNTNKIIVITNYMERD